MAAQIGDDAAVLVFLEKPGWPRGLVEAVRGQDGHVHHAADGSLLYQLLGKHGAFDMQAFPEVYGVLPA